jgi:hypothetical protein
MAWTQPSGRLIAVTHKDTAAMGATLDAALDEVRLRFYAARSEREFHRDRRMLLYALTWPGTWLERRGLTCAPARYKAIVIQRLADIAAHGDVNRYSAYFPAYLLKCIQDWFEHHGEDLYDELKHIRNALDQVLASARFAETVQHDAQHVELLATTNKLIRAKRERRPKPDRRQMTLF